MATGRGDSNPNGFIYAIEGDGFLVSNWGSQNETSWSQSENGNRYCLLNQPRCLTDFAEANGLFGSDNGSFWFNAKTAQQFLSQHGVEVDLDGHTCPFEFSEDAGEIKMQTQGIVDALQPMSARKSGLVIKKPVTTDATPSDHVRVGIHRETMGARYYVQILGDYWHEVPQNDAKNRLIAEGFKNREVTRYLATPTPLELVNTPFAEEFPRQGVWNRCKTRLAFPVSDEAGEHPIFSSILEHCGEPFDDAVAKDAWCQRNGVKTGADWLLLWVAIMLRHPEYRLPGIGLYSESQDCGKSALARCIRLLMTRDGFCQSSRGLRGGFNGELSGKVLVDLDDADLAEGSRSIYQHLLPMMTSNTLDIEEKGRTVRQEDNYLHFIHTANDISKFVLQPGDTRWVLGEVHPLSPKQKIPQMQLDKLLVKEAPYFLHKIFMLDLPEPEGRMYLPVLETEMKTNLEIRRSEEYLSEEERSLLEAIYDAAENSELSDWTEFEKLKELTGTSLNPCAFASRWKKLTPILERAGYEVGHQQNRGGRYPARYRAALWLGAEEVLDV